MTEEKKNTAADPQEAAEQSTPNPPQEEKKQEEAAENQDTDKNKAQKDTSENNGQEFEEKVVKLEDLEEDKEYSDKEMEVLTNLYNQTMNRIQEEEVIKGRILNITDSDVIVDIGFKSEGRVPKEEFDNPDELQVGDEVEVFLETLETIDGQLTLSRRKADFIRNWERLVQKYENDEVIPGTITRRIKGGMVVNLMGVDTFLPGSQIDVKPIRDFDAYLGREMNFKIVKVNHARKNIVVSSRVLKEKEMESKRREILDTLEKGQVRKGTVKNITDFGVFIDLGGVDGLLHITDLSWGRVNHPSELVKLDQELEVMILDFNENKDRISLGLKQLQPHPWENVEEKYPVGSKVNGRVVSITDYGAFIELEKGIEGLIHISEMSWSQHIKHPSQILNVGQEIEAVVLNIEAKEKKISLGLKQLEPDPWEKIEERYPVGSVHKGIVRNLTQFGAFVELEEGIDGLVHISDLSWTKKVRHPSEIVKKGDEIDVVVLGINREERRIALGHKQIEPNPWDSFEKNYNVGTETQGKISRIIEKGMIVTLPLGVDAFIPNQHIGLPKGKKASDIYETDTEIPAKVIEFDKENKKIVLSITEYFKDRERKEFEDYMAKQGVEKTTLEEMAKGSGTEKTKAESGEAKEAQEETIQSGADEKQEVKEQEAEAKAESDEKSVAETEKEEPKAETKAKKEPEEKEQTAEPKAKTEEKKEEAKPESAEKTEAETETKEEKPEKATKAKKEPEDTQQTAESEADKEEETESGEAESQEADHGSEEQKKKDS